LRLGTAHPGRPARVATHSCPTPPAGWGASGSPPTSATTGA
jgi:hypothetical protein